MTPPMRESPPRVWSLGRRILVGLIGYIVALSAAITAFGYVINERAERLVWNSLLETELVHFLHRRGSDADPGASPSDPLELFSSDRLPDELAHLEPGLHDDIVVEGHRRVVLVRQLPGERLVLALDIDSPKSARKRSAARSCCRRSASSSCSRCSRSSARAISPIRCAASPAVFARSGRSARRSASRCRPERAPVVVIVDAMNDFLGRNEQFVDRERAFVDTASHELRTPVAVISGAAQNALSDPALAVATRHRIERIRETANDIRALTAVLLVLARDPARLGELNDRVPLDQVLRSVVDVSPSSLRRQIAGHPLQPKVAIRDRGAAAHRALGDRQPAAQRDRKQRSRRDRRRAERGRRGRDRRSGARHVARGNQRDPSAPRQSGRARQRRRARADRAASASISAGTSRSIPDPAQAAASRSRSLHARKRPDECCTFVSDPAHPGRAHRATRRKPNGARGSSGHRRRYGAISSATSIACATASTSKATVASTTHPRRTIFTRFAAARRRDDLPCALITGGVHGYETSGVMGALQFAERHASDYAGRVNLLIAPCVSPWAYERIHRWNPDAIDPNRSFREPSPAGNRPRCCGSSRRCAVSFLVHVDLHETTDSDESEFRPALAARDSRPFEPGAIRTASTPSTTARTRSRRFSARSSRRSRKSRTSRPPTPTA